MFKPPYSPTFFFFFNQSNHSPLFPSRVDLPKLKEVSGDFNLQATNDVGCDKLSKDIKENVEGQFTCKEKIADPKTSKGSDSGSASKTSSGSSPTETNGAVAVANAASLGLVAAIVGAMVL